MADLRIAHGLSLDPDYVGGGTFALLAKKGAGKTYAGRVMAEEMWKAKVPFVALDPMGAWWGLRAASADAKGEGIPVAIFGGDHGDAPLERKGGALMADLVVEEGLSAILDMSALGSRAGEREFALDFLERLYRRNSELVHLFVDEADLFAPQKPQSGDQQLLGVTENIVRRGRNRGIGVTLITQRPAVLNKDVLTQVDGLVAMRITGYTDREAIDDWVKGHGDQEAAREVKGTLSGLATGESWWWIPELDVLERVQVREARTFDSSPTKRRGEKRRDPKTFADVDMGAIEAKMTATIERAKADDPKELRRQIRDLKGQLAKASDQPAPEPKVEQVEVPVLSDEARQGLAELAESLAESATAISESAAAIAAAVKRTQSTPPARPQPAATPPAAPRKAASPPRRREPTGQPQDNGDIRLSGSQQRLLDALAWFEAIGVPTPRRSPLGAVAGSSPKSSGFEKNLSTLRTAGLLDYPDAGRVGLTEAGRSLAEAPGFAPTEEELHEAVFRMVSRPQAELLRVLIAEYPDGLGREELAERAGVSAASSGFEKNISTLKSFELVGYPARGEVAALSLLFLEEART